MNETPSGKPGAIQDHVQFLARLVELELIDRERRMVERRVKAAKFPATKSLDSFDFKAIPKLNKMQVLERFPIQRVILVADRGLLSLENIDELIALATRGARRLEFILAVPARRYAELVDTFRTLTFELPRVYRRAFRSTVQATIPMVSGGSRWRSSASAGGM